MRLTIELSPDVEAGLLAQAQARGLDIPHYVENVLRREAMAQTEASATSRPAYELPPEEWVRALRAWSQSHADADFSILSDEAMSRETIYEDRGL